MAHRTTIAIVVAALLAIGINALPATGHDVTPTGTLTFSGKAKKRDQRMVDLAPKGISLGDRFLLAETLKHAGATAGRIEAGCEIIDRS